jgi:hypothetical protein
VAELNVPPFKQPVIVHGAVVTAAVVAAAVVIISPLQSAVVHKL